jgi:hypothetical protein
MFLSGQPVKTRRTVGFRDRQKRKLLVIPEQLEDCVQRNIDNTYGGGWRVLEVQKLVSVGEVEKPCADAFESDFRTAGQKLSADGGRWLCGCFVFAPGDI